MVVHQDDVEALLHRHPNVIAWIAGQPWCDGGVGIIGISWGGFNGLQIAALRPPALKAVITVCSTDDRYADDVHYMGGCLLIDNISWAAQMFARNTLPPDPLHRGEDWKKLWMERLDRSGLWLKDWLEQKPMPGPVRWLHGPRATQPPAGPGRSYSAPVRSMRAPTEITRTRCSGP